VREAEVAEGPGAEENVGSGDNDMVWRLCLRTASFSDDFKNAPSRKGTVRTGKGAQGTWGVTHGK
jgi:hypothetical protein